MSEEELYYKPNSKTLREEPQVFTRWIDPTIEQLQQENKQLKEQLEYLRSNEYLNQVKWERNFNEKLVKDLQGKIDILIEDNSQLEEIRIKAIEYNKEVLTWITNEPITDEIAYKNLEILGDKENENNNI